MENWHGEQIDLGEDCEIGWREYMTEFREKVYPMFQQQGFSFPEAFLAWQLNRVVNAVEREDDNGT